MKKFLKSKGFPVTVLSVSCISILAACWLVGRDTKTAFLPDEQPPDATQEEWKDTPETAGNSSREHTDAAVPGQNRTEEKLEGYPKVEEESEQEVVIDFIPAETKDETPPPPPEDKTVTAEPDRETSTASAPEVSPSSSHISTMENSSTITRSASRPSFFLSRLPSSSSLIRQSPL